METQNFTLTMNKQKSGTYEKNNNKGITLLEALVAVVIVAIGFLSVYQLSSYAVNSIDASIDRNKINFLSEMMAEDMLADPANIKNYQFSDACTLNNTSGSELYKIRQNKWKERFKAQFHAGQCKNTDEKKTILSDPPNTFTVTARINLTNRNGTQKKYLGLVIKK